MTKWDFEKLRNQFILVKNEKWIPAGWIVQNAGNWILATHPSLPVINLKSSHSKLFMGWLLGYPISLSEKRVLTVKNLECPDSHWLEAENWLYSFAGRYLGILYLGNKSPRIYPDPSSSLAAIYSSSLEVVCSTCSAICKGRCDNDWASDLVEAAEKRGWYPFGLTPHRTLYRVLPNHYLDCGSWETFRCWPFPGGIDVVKDSSDYIRGIFENIKSTIAAVNHFGAYITLTAGADSRMVLACAREEIIKSTFLTGGKNLDSHIAGILAKRFGLKHIVVELIKTTMVEQEKRLFVCGYCTDIGGLTKQGRDSGLLNKGKIILLGLGGEVGRGSSWRERALEGDSISSRKLVSIMGFPLTPKLINHAEHWLQGMENFSTCQLIDLAYLEQRLGCWGGPNRYFYDARGFVEIYAFNHRNIYRSFLRLPHGKEINRLGLAKELIREFWPELLSVPINEYTGFRKIDKLLRKILHDLFVDVRSLVKFR
jgi:hypothetical protein